MPALFAHVSTKDAGQLVLSTDAPQAECNKLLYLLKGHHSAQVVHLRLLFSRLMTCSNCRVDCAA